MTKKINKVYKNGQQFEFTDNVAQSNIDLIVDELNKLEIPDSTSDLINDSGFITINDVNYKIVNNLEDVTSPKEGDLAYAISLKKIYKYNGSVWEELSTGGGGSSSNIVNLTQEEYDALEVKDPNTIYNITDAQDIDVYKKSETYSKTEIDNKGFLTGYTETDPKWTSEKGNYYTKTEVDAKIPDISKKQDKLVSGSNIKTINNQSILGSGNIEVKGGGGNIVQLTKAEYEALGTKDPDTLYIITDVTDVYTKEETEALVQGLEERMVEAFDVVQEEIEGKQETLVSGTNIKTINGETILGEGNITIQGGGTGAYLPLTGGTLSGKIQIGDATSNIPNAILHIRSCASSITGKKVNGACYSVNADGTASLQHKTYNDDGGGAKNAAVLRMSNQGLQFAINTGSSSTPSEDMYKEIATQEYVDNKIGDIETLLHNI